MRVWTLLANSLGHTFLIVTFRRWPQEEELRNLKYMATCVESQSLNETAEAIVFQHSPKCAGFRTEVCTHGLRVLLETLASDT